MWGVGRIKRFAIARIIGNTFSDVYSSMKIIFINILLSFVKWLFTECLMTFIHALNMHIYLNNICIYNTFNHDLSICYYLIFLNILKKYMKWLYINLNYFWFLILKWWYISVFDQMHFHLNIFFKEAFLQNSHLKYVDFKHHSNLVLQCIA